MARWHSGRVMVECPRAVAEAGLMRIPEAWRGCRTWAWAAASDTGALETEAKCWMTWEAS